MNLKLLKKKDLCLLVLGKFVSNTGNLMQQTALALYVLKITSSSTKFASVLALAIIPQIVLGPFGGVLADWFDRKKIIVSLDMLNGIITGVFAGIYFFNGELTMTQIYSAVMIFSIISVLFNPTMKSVIPSIMEKEELVEANSIDSFFNGFSPIIAPVLAGMIYGIYGLLPILIINSISFIASSISEMFINIPHFNNSKVDKNIGQFKKDFVEGIEFIKSKKDITLIIMCAFMINFVINPLTGICIPFVTKNIIKISDFQFGIMEGITSIGTIVGAFLAAKINSKFKIQDIVGKGLFIVGCITMIISLVFSPIILNNFGKNIPFISVIVLGFMIVCNVIIVNISISTITQKLIPLSMMGRVNAVTSTLCMAAIPGGQMLFGKLIEVMDPYISALITAFSVMVISLIYLTKSRKASLITLKNIKEKVEISE